MPIFSGIAAAAGKATASLQTLFQKITNSTALVQGAYPLATDSSGNSYLHSTNSGQPNIYSENSTLYSVNASTGTINWSVSYNQSAFGDTTYYEGRYSGTYVIGNNVYALGLTTDGSGTWYGAIARHTKSDGTLQAVALFGGDSPSSPTALFTPTSTTYIVKISNIGYKYTTDPTLNLINPSDFTVASLATTYLPSAAAGGYGGLACFGQYIYIWSASRGQLIQITYNEATGNFTKAKSISFTNLSATGSEGRLFVDSSGYLYTTYWGPSLNVTKVDFSGATPTVVWSKNITVAGNSNTISSYSSVSFAMDSTDNLKCLLTYNGYFTSVEPTNSGDILFSMNSSGAITNTKKIRSYTTAIGAGYQGTGFTSTYISDALQLTNQNTIIMLSNLVGPNYGTYGNPYSQKSYLTIKSDFSKTYTTTTGPITYNKTAGVSNTYTATISVQNLLTASVTASNYSLTTSTPAADTWGNYVRGTPTVVNSTYSRTADTFANEFTQNV